MASYQPLSSLVMHGLFEGVPKRKGPPTQRSSAQHGTETTERKQQLEMVGDEEEEKKGSDVLSRGGRWGA